MVLVKVHRVVSFEQSPWLAPFIMFNTERRKQAKRDGDVSRVGLYKLINNSTFGKTMQDPFKQRRVELYTAPGIEKALDNIRSPYIRNWKVIIPDQLIVQELAKKEVRTNSPIAIGAVVLEHSKEHMFHHHYYVVRSYFAPEESKLLYTDTDSLVYQLTPPAHDPSDSFDELVAKFQWHTDSLDLSETKPPHLDEIKRHYYMLPNAKEEFPLNAMVLGKFKDEASEGMYEWVALRSKLYSFIKSSGAHVKKTKGIREKATVERNMHEKQMAVIEGENKGLIGKEFEFFVNRRMLSHDDFVDVAHEGDAAARPVEFTVLRPNAGKCRVREDTGAWNMETLRVRKRGLSNRDTKSYYLGPLESLRYGHYRVREMEELMDCLMEIGELD